MTIRIEGRVVVITGLPTSVTLYGDAYKHQAMPDSDMLTVGVRWE